MRWSDIQWKRQLRNALLAYAVLMAALFFMQRSLLYKPFGDYAPHPTAQELRLPTADGHEALAWFLPPPEDSVGKVVVFFHGNGGGLGYGTSLASRLRQSGFGVLMPEYRGYPGYAGDTTEQGIYADARASMEFLQQSGYAPASIYLLGQSLGSGVAVQMASEYEVGLLTLISPFTAIADAAAEIYWYAPVQWLVLDRFDSYSKIGGIHAPVQIFHGTEDRLVPFAQGQRLYERANPPKRFYALEGRGHNTVDMAFVVNRMRHFALDGTL